MGETSPKPSHLKIQVLQRIKMKVPSSVLIASCIALSSRAEALPTAAQWAKFNMTIHGRLHRGIPLAEPCYSNYNGTATTPNQAACSAVQSGYDNTTYISGQYSGFMNTNWGTCQNVAQGCPLNYNAPTQAIPAGQQCYQGVVSPYYVEVQAVSDIQAAFAFAKQTGVHISIKNSGHDYRGRSSSPNSLALWTHKIQPALKLERNFIPEGCSAPVGDGVTMGAGQGFAGLYEFAGQNGITVMGGASPTVGATGGWITGGGHGALSNMFGLGVDNALQIRGVLPNGSYVTANECQNPDLWFAWRGGGGSTFGVNFEMTTRAHPKVELQVIVVNFYTSQSFLRNFLQICIQYGNQWASQGWGGYITSNQQYTGLVLMTSKLNYFQAVASMRPLMNYVSSLGFYATLNRIDTVDGFTNVFENYLLPGELVGLGTAIGGRLIPSSQFATASSQSALLNAMMTFTSLITPPTRPVASPDPQITTYGAPLQILLVTPNNHPTTAQNDTSSIHPAWRSAVWSVIANVPFANGASAADVSEAFQVAHNATAILRRLVPGSGAYLNEADVFETDPVGTFWGQAHYQRLVGIKRILDPGNLLTCWDCIGWDPSDERFGCYPDVQRG